MTQSFPVGLRTIKIYSLYLWASVLDIYFEIKVLGKPWRYWIIRYIDIYRKRYGLLAWGKTVAFTMVDTKIPWTNKHKQEINKCRYLIEHPINSLFVFFVCAIFVILASTLFVMPEDWALGNYQIFGWMSAGVFYIPTQDLLFFQGPTLQPKCSMGRWYVYLPTSSNGLGWWFGARWFGIQWGTPKNPNPFHFRGSQESKTTRPPNHQLHPSRLTWNIITEVWKIIFLSKWVICRFHVNLPGCNH